MDALRVMILEYYLHRRLHEYAPSSLPSDSHPAEKNQNHGDGGWIGDSGLALPCGLWTWRWVHSRSVIRACGNDLRRRLECGATPSPGKRHGGYGFRQNDNVSDPCG